MDAPGAPAPLPDLGTGPVPVPGQVMEVLPGVRRLTASNPGVMTGPGTNTYLLGTREVAVLDPGPDDAAQVEALVEAADEGGGSIRWVLVTHTHPDHAPNAARLARATGAAVIGFEPREGFVPDMTAGDGWELETGEVTLRAVHTPGHAGDHNCWLLPGDGVLFTGDHVMHGSTVVIRPPDGDMATYLRSLERVLHLDPPVRIIAPGHGRLIGDLGAAVRSIIGHRMEREAVVVRALAADGPATIDRLVASIYADVDPDRLPIAKGSLWAHLRKLADEGRAHLDRPAEEGLEGVWSSAAK